MWFHIMVSYHEMIINSNYLLGFFGIGIFFLQIDENQLAVFKLRMDDGAIPKMIIIQLVQLTATQRGQS